MKLASKITLASASLLITASIPVRATNGLALEGNGPVAQSLGGASIAVDTGNAGVVNNPATLTLTPATGGRLEAGVGYIGIDITSSVPGGPSADSQSTAFFLPSLSWIKQSGALAYGAGLYAQGGLGAEYKADSFLALNSGDKVRSELMVGRVLFPLAYQVTPALTLGGSIDVVSSGLDLKVALPGARIPGLVTGGNLRLPPLGASDYARIDFSDDSDFSGEAQGYGLGGKLGLVYKLGDRVTFGGIYQPKTEVEDLTTDNGELSFGSSRTGTQAGALKGKITVKDLQWPETYGVGLTVKATDALTLAADVKRYGWSDVLDGFRLNFTSAQAGSVDFTLPQNWKDQTVLSLGAALAVTDQWTLRAGYNHAENPVPDAFLNPLFPATVEDHFTGGFTYAPNATHAFEASFALAPEVSDTNGDGIGVDHSQLNAQITYRLAF